MMVQVAVVGPSRPTLAEAAAATQVGELLAQHDVVLLCGGEEGVMEAVSEGARRAGGQVVGLLGGPNRNDANAFLTTTVVTGIGEARNNILIRSADAVVAVGGSWGTLVEVALAVKLRRPVIALWTWRVSDDAGAAVDQHIQRACSAEHAVRLVLAAILRR